MNNEMLIKVERKWKKDTYTIGRVYIDGIYFSNSLEDVDRGLDDSMSEEEIKSKKVYGKTAIPTGRYEVIYTYSPKFRRHLPRLQNVKGFTGILVHCLTPETEILTENGWQTLDDFKSNPALNCYSFNMESKKIELTPINFMVEEPYNGILYSNNGKRINYSVTDKHKIYAGFKKRDGSYVWELRDANSIPHTQVKFKVAGMMKGENILPHQKTLYRLLMATVADGYILNWSAKSSQVRFHFTKDRKIERIKELVTEIGGDYKCFTDNVGKTHIVLDNAISEMLTEILNPFRYIQKHKMLPYDLLRLNGEDLKDLVLEYLFWDGRYENYLKNKKNMVISCTNLHNLNVLQAMATLSGLRTYIKDESGGCKHGEQHSKCYALVLYEGQDEVMPEAETFGESEYNGTVWCLNNDNHTIIIRKGNRPMIIGNCGNTENDTDGCIIVGLNSIKGMVTNSRWYSDAINKRIDKAIRSGKKVYIEIV